MMNCLPTRQFRPFHILAIFLALPFILITATQVRAQSACDARFSYYTLTQPDSLHFYPLVNSPHARYHWSFGDGTASTEPHPWHVFTSAGTYVVCLTVTDSTSAGTCTDTVCDSVVIAATQGPICDAQFSYYSIAHSDSLHFYPLTNSVHAQYHWNFGDGTGSTEHYPWHLFPSAGTYVVCLTVTDSTSAGTCTDTVCDTFVIVSHVRAYPNPVNDFVTFTIPSGAGPIDLAIHDDEGQLVIRSQSASNGSLGVRTDGLSSGVYFYFLIRGKSILASGKFMVMRSK